MENNIKYVVLTEDHIKSLIATIEDVLDQNLTIENQKINPPIETLSSRSAQNSPAGSRYKNTYPDTPIHDELMENTLNCEKYTIGSLAYLQKYGLLNDD